MTQQADAVTYSGDISAALPLTRTPQKVSFIAGQSQVFRPGVDFIVRSGSVLPTSFGRIASQPAGSPLTVVYSYDGPATPAAYPYQAMHVLSYGQSLSIGESAGIDFNSGNYQPLSTVQAFDSKMFVGGALPQLGNANTAVDYASLVPLVEANNTTNPTQMAVYNLAYPGETPLSGLFDWIRTEAAREGTFPAGAFFLGSACGRGGTSIANLAQGTTPYTRLLLEVTKGKALASSMGKTYGVPAVLWLQGEADLGNNGYQAALATLFSNLNTDIKAITGQSPDVHFFMYQTANPDPTAWSQYNLQKTQANVHIAAPVYQLPKGNGVHLTAAGSRAWGAMAGRAIKRQLFGAGGFAALQPQTITISGGKLILVTNSKTGIALDGSGGVAGPSYGFGLADGSGNNVPITSVSAAGNVITISPQSVASGYTLYYGGSGGGVRDNQGYIDRAGGLGAATIPMHNWMATFKVPL